MQVLHNCREMPMNELDSPQVAIGPTPELSARIALGQLLTQSGHSPLQARNPARYDSVLRGHHETARFNQRRSLLRTRCSSDPLPKKSKSGHAAMALERRLA
jgi:hypothetical protein